MKTQLHLTSAVYALLASTAIASPVWETGSYDPATWQADPDNVIAGLGANDGAPTYNTAGGIYGTIGKKSVFLTDGIIEEPIYCITNLVGIKSGWMEWKFAAKRNIQEVRLFSHWFSGQHDGISLASVQYQKSGSSTWYTLDNSAVSVGMGDDTSSGALYVCLKDSEGGNLVDNATRVRLYFNSLDNSWTTFAEFEVVGETALPNVRVTPVPGFSSAALDGTVQFVGTGATSATLSYAIAPHGTALPAATAVSGTFAKGDTFSIPLSGLEWNTAYDYAVTILNDQGETRTASGTFSTRDETCGCAALDAGLWEVRIDGTSANSREVDWETNAWALVVGPEVTQRHRELGAEMAYVTGSRTSTINPGRSYAWKNYSEFVYVGYMYIQANTTYIFESSIDDTAYLKIGDTVVKNCTTHCVKNDQSTWTSGAAGWYPVDLRMGDASGGHGQISGCYGFRYSIDGGTTWRYMRDPGDGSFFRTRLDDPVVIDGVMNTGSELRLNLSFREDVAGGVPAIATAAAYGDTDVSAWATTSYAPVGSGESARTIAAPVNQGDTCFRAYLTLDGTNYWTRTLYLEDYDIVDATLPSFSFGGVNSTTSDTAEFLVTVAATGDGYDACDLVLTYGTDPSALTQTATFAGNPVGNATLTLTGLTPERTYYGTFIARNASSSTDPSAVFSFQTKPISGGSSAYLAASLPGLVQSVYTNLSASASASTIEATFAVSTPDIVNREPGAVMAYIGTHSSVPAEFRTSHTCDFDGTERTFTWTDNTTYIYTGYVWLDAVEYIYTTYFTKYSFLKIDDDVLISYSSVYSNPLPFRTYETAGWHRFELRAGVLATNPRGAGDGYGSGSGMAFGYSTDPDYIYYGHKYNGHSNNYNGHGVPRTGWDRFLDETGTFLRTANPMRDIKVGAYTTVGGSLTADLSFGPNNVIGEETASYDLHVAYGASCGGDDPNSWSATAAVTTLPCTDDAYTFTGIPGAGTTVKYARFYLTDGSAVRWADPIYLADPASVALATGFSVDDSHLGDTLVVSGALASPGAGETAAVSILVSTSPDLSNAAVWPVDDLEAGDAFSVTLHGDDPNAALYIQPGTTLYVAAVAEDANGAKDRTDIIAVAMPGAPVLADAVATTPLNWNATFSGELATLGAGDTTTVTLYTGPAADALTNTASIVVSTAGPVEIDVEFPEFGTIYYQLRADSSCATASWSDTTPVASFDLTDSATYTWKSDCAEGDWSDAGNWTCSIDDSRLSFPNSPTCKATFAGCAGEVAVHLDGVYTVDSLNINIANFALSFIGSGTNDSSLVVQGDGNVNLGAGESLLLDGAALDVYKLPPASGSSIRLQNAAYLGIRADRIMDSTNERIELAGGSVMYVKTGFRQRNSNNVLRIEDATFTTPGNFCPSDFNNSKVIVTEFAGTRPVLSAYQVRPADNSKPTSGIQPVFRFEIPAAGYEVVPIVQNRNFPATTGIPIHFEVPADAGCFSVAGTARFKLVALTAGNIQTAGIDFADQPRPEQTRFYYTYGANDSLEPSGNPTGLWVEIKGNGATVILFR